jgi:hypothetical protein
MSGESKSNSSVPKSEQNDGENGETIGEEISDPETFFSKILEKSIPKLFPNKPKLLEILPKLFGSNQDYDIKRTGIIIKLFEIYHIVRDYIKSNFFDTNKYREKINELKNQMKIFREMIDKQFCDIKSNAQIEERYYKIDFNRNKISKKTPDELYYNYRNRNHNDLEFDSEDMMLLDYMMLKDFFEIIKNYQMSQDEILDLCRKQIY